jgi:pimeloyl-ACP methyl ester carboxylesterase
MNRRQFCLGIASAAAVACRHALPVEGTVMNDVTNRKKTFVFVAGSWHGAWSWYKVLPRLQALGHGAIAVDLPGHGTAWKTAKDVTLQSYVEAVTSVLDRQPDPVVLVGHSRAGIVISSVAEERPERIDHLVYLAAFLIPNGESMLQTATADTESHIVPNLVFDEAAGTHMLKREAFRDALYADCSADDVALATLLLTPEPNVRASADRERADRRNVNTRIGHREHADRRT